MPFGGGGYPPYGGGYNPFGGSGYPPCGSGAPVGGGGYHPFGSGAPVGGSGGKSKGSKGAPVGGSGAPVDGGSGGKSKGGSGGKSKGGSGAPVGGGSGGKSKGGSGAPVGGGSGGNPANHTKKKKPYGGSPHGGSMHPFGGGSMLPVSSGAETEAGMPVLGYTSKGPHTKKVVFKDVITGGPIADVEYDESLYNLVLPPEDYGKIMPVTGPDALSLKKSSKASKAIKDSVVGPAQKDEDQKNNAKASDADKAARRLAKAKRAGHMKKSVDKLNKGENLEEAYEIDRKSKAMADAQSKLYYQAIQQASMAASHAAYGGHGPTAYGRHGPTAYGGHGHSAHGGRGGGGRGGGGRGRGSGSS